MDKILVVGSSNTDLIATVDHLPAAGETTKGFLFQQTMGGKGANQALAAHRAGGDVTFVTCLGRDDYGKKMLKYFSEEGLDVFSFSPADDSPTGTAMIWIDKTGENSIVVIPGANKMLTPELIYDSKEKIDNADIIMLQMEIPYETVKSICEIAFKKGKKVLLNVAPAGKLDEDIIKSIYLLIVNETEAEVICGEKVNDTGEEALVKKLLSMGIKNVVLTLGRRGSLYMNINEMIIIPAFHVDAVDSTAAGDTFCGALAAQLSRGYPLKESLEFATAAAAICVTRMGAQPSIPFETEVNEFINQLY